MAVYAAHLTRTATGAPSVFQVVAQDALGATVKPALSRLVQYLAAVYPKKFGWCVGWYDELFLVFDCCLQYHYLKHYAGSFAESFYGMLRVPMRVSNEFSSGQRLPDSLERGSLLLLALLPYLRDKVDALVDKWREDEGDGWPGKDAKSRAKWACIRVHAVSHALSTMARAIQLWQYLRGRSSSHSLELRALGLGLRDAPPPDEDTTASWSDLVRGIVTGDSRAAWASVPAVGGVALRCVEYGAFGVQFLRWWDSRGRGDVALPTPPPPQRDERASRVANKCPLCLQPWRIPTVLPVSGYVFCYTCISRSLKSVAQCPVTGLPATASSLGRLYLDA